MVDAAGPHGDVDAVRAGGAHGLLLVAAPPGVRHDAAHAAQLPLALPAPVDPGRGGRPVGAALS